MGHRVGELARVIGGELLGRPEQVVERISPFDSAGPDAITFVSQSRYEAELARTKAGCVILSPALRAQGAALAERGASAIVCPEPYLAYARLSQFWALSQRPARPAGVHASAVVSPSAEVHATARVGALAYVGDGAVIASGAVVGEQSHVGAHARIGEGTVLAPRVVLGERCRIGARGIVHSGAVIGADGFGFAPDGGRWVKIEQLGAVRIGDDVEIGANTCIDRGAIEDTVLEDGVKLDNLVQIAHNVRVGAHTAMAGCVAVAGSTTIGAHCTIAGAARIVGHLEIADHVHISATTLVSRSIRKAGHYSGAFPFDENAAWEKNAATLRQLYTLRERVRALEKKS